MKDWMYFHTVCLLSLILMYVDENETTKVVWIVCSIANVALMLHSIMHGE